MISLVSLRGNMRVIRVEGQADFVLVCYRDDAVENAVRKARKDDPDGNPQYFESRIAYILTTGGNWAAGDIGKFKLTVDKGNPKSLVSFCGENVRKVGPTTFEMTANDFYPEHDIDILLLNPSDSNGNGN